MTPPAKKTEVPAFSELTNKNDPEPVDVEVNRDSEGNPAVEEELDADETFVDSEEVDLGGVSLVDPSKDHVHTWEENHDHNLARVHPDVKPEIHPPSEHAGVTSTVVNIEFSAPNVNDDTGRSAGLVDEDEVKNDEEIVE